MNKNILIELEEISRIANFQRDRLNTPNSKNKSYILEQALISIEIGINKIREMEDKEWA